MNGASIRNFQQLGTLFGVERSHKVDIIRRSALPIASAATPRRMHYANHFERPLFATGVHSNRQ
jgi:hypothetical protein